MPTLPASPRPGVAAVPASASIMPIAATNGRPWKACMFTSGRTTSEKRQRCIARAPRAPARRHALAARVTRRVELGTGGNSIHLDHLHTPQFAHDMAHAVLGLLDLDAVVAENRAGSCIRSSSGTSTKSRSPISGCGRRSFLPPWSRRPSTAGPGRWCAGRLPWPFWSGRGPARPRSS